MRRYFVPFLLFMGTLYFGYLYLQDPDAELSVDSSKRSHGSVHYNQLQQYRQETDVKMDIAKQQLQMNKRLGGPAMDPGRKKKNQFHKTELRKDEDPRLFDLEEASTYKAMTLDQRMDEFLAKRQRYEELEKSQKTAYVQAFIREAYKMGFVVVVNDEMEIESVEKVP